MRQDQFSQRMLLMSIVFVLVALCVSSQAKDTSRVDAQWNRIVVANIDAHLLPDSSQVVGVLRGHVGKWRDGAIITVVLPSRKHPAFGQLDSDFFIGRGVSLQRHWLQLVFGGQGHPPRYVSSNKEMCDVVRETRGSYALFYGTVPELCQSLPQFVYSTSR